ncbi:Arginine deiminase [Streptomyces glaucescens]
MRWPARQRETVHFEAIYRHHPLFRDERFPRWSEGQADYPSTIEGGDVLVIGNGAVLIGMKRERTTPQAVEMLAHKLFAAGSATTIVALDMPKRRAFMHLDTVMTMVGGDTFTQYAGLGMLRSYTIEPGAGDKELKVTDHPPEHMHRAIAAALGLTTSACSPPPRTSTPPNASSGTTAAMCSPSSRASSSPTNATPPPTPTCANRASR